MLHSYDEIYTAKAQTSLAQMLRYAEEDMHIELNEFWDMFLISGVARGWRPHGKLSGDLPGNGRR